MPGNIVALDIHLPEPKDAAHDILWEGNGTVPAGLYPVTRMFGFDGQIVHSGLRAFSCVAYLGKQWVAMECKPGEVQLRRGVSKPRTEWRDL